MTPEIQAYFDNLSVRITSGAVIKWTYRNKAIL